LAPSLRKKLRKNSVNLTFFIDNSQNETKNAFFILGIEVEQIKELMDNFIIHLD